MLGHEVIVLRLLLAVVLGGLVGLERERLEWVAGLRTHMLVCLGAAVVMLVSSFGFADIPASPQVVLDPSRVAAQVISGIGFLGAGTIMFLRHQVIRGLTTAASLWTVAGVGLAIGGGLYVVAVTATVLVLVVLVAIKPLERWMFRRGRSRELVMRVDRHRLSLPQLDATLTAAGLAVSEISLKRGESPDDDEIRLRLPHNHRKTTLLPAAGLLQQLEGVREVTF